MQKAPIAVLGVIAAVALSGCGTICNLAGGYEHPESEPCVYGGVIKDIEFADALMGGEEKLPFPNPSGGKNGGVPVLIYILLVMSDPALSFAADTLTLPITIYAERKRAAADHGDAGIGSLSATPAPANASLGNPESSDEP